MKMVFMGTPEYAAGALEALIGAGHEITAVVTQPDKPRGRSGKPQPPPVKLCAEKHGIPVLQPRRVKAPEAVEALRGYAADIYVVAAFGQILSREILDIPPLGCLNIHGSLLPRHRGASPIQHAILNGDSETGITIMRMDEVIDTGDMLYKKAIPILPEDTFETLYARLTVLGGEAVTEALRLLEQNQLAGEKQQEALSSYAPMMKREMGKIDFAESAAAIDRRIRAMNPWPGAYTDYQGKQLKIWKAAPCPAENGLGRQPGEILCTDKDSVTVAAGEGALRIYELQLEGKKRMTAHDFLLGVRLQPGEILGVRKS